MRNKVTYYHQKVYSTTNCNELQYTAIAPVTVGDALNYVTNIVK